MSHPQLRSLAGPGLVLVLCAGLSGPSAPLRAEDLPLTFGVYTSDKPTDMYRAFKPILTTLEQDLSKLLGKTVQIKLRVFTSYDAAREGILKEEVDFARFGPSPYILAHEKNAGIRLLAIEEQDGQYTFKGVIFTREKDGVAEVKDLKGKAFAFGDPDSTIGRYLSQAFLVGAGIYARDLSRFEYMDRHDKVVDAVLSGKFDAGAAKESTFLKYKDKGLKVLHTFDNVTKPWVARSKLDPAIGDAIQKCLAGFKDKKALDAIGEKVTGFSTELARDETYELVRQGMKKSLEFEQGPTAPPAVAPPQAPATPAATPPAPPAAPAEPRPSGAAPVSATSTGAAPEPEKAPPAPAPAPGAPAPGAPAPAPSTGTP